MRIHTLKIKRAKKESEMGTTHNLKMRKKSRYWNLTYRQKRFPSSNLESWLFAIESSVHTDLMVRVLHKRKQNPIILQRVQTGRPLVAVAKRSGPDQTVPERAGRKWAGRGPNHFLTILSFNGQDGPKRHHTILLFYLYIQRISATKICMM